MKEIWKDIDGYEGLYQISSLGRVKSLERVDRLGRLWPERIRRLNKDGWGYLHVQLYRDGKEKIHKIHRLVAKAFIPNPDNLPCINHKNEHKTDNRVDNLEWCTYKYNCNYGTARQRMVKKMINGKNSKTIFQYTSKGEFIKEWPSTMEIQRQMGYANSHINQCCLGRRKTAYGYIWRYAS